MSRRGRSGAIGRGLGAAVALLVVALAGEAAHAEASAATADASRPNVLLLVAEDLSPRLGADGDPVARTPNLDRLAAEGVRFTRVFTTAGVCAPSRAALILGRHQIATGTMHMRTSSGPLGEYLAVPPPEAKAFPETLRRGGYFTWSLGKLDYQFSGVFAGSGPRSIWDREGEADAWRAREVGQPFFGMVNFMVTHESGLFPPLPAWPSSMTHLVMQLVQARERWGWTDAVVPTDPARVALPPYYPDHPAIRGDLARQYDNLQILDAQVGDWLERLERDGLADSTIVIFTSDHGDGLPRAKRELFDSGLHVPLVIRWPARWRPAGLAPGDVDARLISWMDLAAMILGMTGTPVPEGLHARDVLDPATPPRVFVYAARDRIDDTMDRQRAVRDARYKYIRSFHPALPASEASDFREHLASMRAWRAAYAAGELPPAQRAFFEPPGEERLFDLAQDPHEVYDLSAEATHRATLESMRAAYADFARRVPDLGALPEPALRERFWPGGEQPRTPPPTLHIEDGRLVAASGTPGASIEVSIDRGPWRPWVEPRPLPAGAQVAARAIRYGWRESEIVGTRAP